MGEQVRIRDCGDGFRRADNGSFAKVVAKAASYTIGQIETGTLFTNAGAGGAVTFTLPVPKPGIFFAFAKTVVGQSLILKAPSGVSINNGTAGQVYKNTETTVLATVTLVGVETAANTVHYAVQSEKGTWSNAAS